MSLVNFVLCTRKVFFFFFWGGWGGGGGVYLPFTEYFTYIKPIIKQKWELPEGNSLGPVVQN